LPPVNWMFRSSICTKGVMVVSGVQAARAV